MSATWTIEDNRLTHDDLPAPLEHIMAEPYPPFWWSVRGGRLVHTGLPAPVLRGAFANCVSLDTAHIPHSCEEIGKYAFRNTALDTVTISEECTYSATSFPDDCTVEFYESEDDNSE
jgi:hypothetical protein